MRKILSAAVVAGLVMAAGVAATTPASAAACIMNRGRTTSAGYAEDANNSCGYVAVRVQYSPTPGVEVWSGFAVDQVYAYKSVLPYRAIAIDPRAFYNG